MRYALVLLCLLLAFATIAAQDTSYPSLVVHPNQEVTVKNLHLKLARWPGETAALAGALETILDFPQLCCGRNSSIPALPASARSNSLQEIAAKLNGKHVLSDGRPVFVAAHYFSASAITSHQIVAFLMENQALLVQWDSHFFVLSGAVFDDKVYSDGNRDIILRKLRLFDPDATAAAHEITFDREKDQWSEVQGFLLIKATRP